MSDLVQLLDNVKDPGPLLGQVGHRPWLSRRRRRGARHRPRRSGEPAHAGAGGGKHYSSEAVFPFVPGFDGVGRLADGQRVYFAGRPKPFGAMAERVAIAKARCAPIPHGVINELL